MKVHLYIDYYTKWGEIIYITGSSKELGEWDENKAIPLQYTEPSNWRIELDIENDFEYRYFVKEGLNTIRCETGFPHRINHYENYSVHVYDTWQEKDKDQYLYTSGFTDSFFAHQVEKEDKLYDKTIVLNIKCPFVEKDSVLCMTGSTIELGEWNVEKAKRACYKGDGIWTLILDAQTVKHNAEYKFVIYDPQKEEIKEWELGANRILLAAELEEKSISIENLEFRVDCVNMWRMAGVAIPVFSLRSEGSCGVGDFLDLHKMVDWAAQTNQRVIQILPINDTTSTLTNSDSYPYSAISVYALHPIYLGLGSYPLKDKALNQEYQKSFKILNDLEKLDYEQVIKEKLSYLRVLYSEIGKNTLSQTSYRRFFEENETWLYPYACFCYLRDKYKTAEIKRWGEYNIYNEYKIQKMTSKNEVKEEIKFTYFCQFLLHEQLTKVRNYAHEKGIILKGDIPIGVDPNSVDVWVEPQLFNLDTQTGAPPDDFAEDGQNWGFPTYNWDEMSKDGYQWWVKRFRKMADYFDAYRIDHILGFFRIWEIPSHSIHGLLGYFNPALPYSVDELISFGFEFDKDTMINPYICDQNIADLFGNRSEEVKITYLEKISQDRYKLKNEFDTQVKIRDHFGKTSEISVNLIQNGLYKLCNEVLFIRDKYCPESYHPRISAYRSYVYQALSESNRLAFDQLYDHFYYHRHNDFWRDNAMKKLPKLISSTRMLTCGEDLGMIPDCVPHVMKELQILSLEIERMPKTMTLFAQLSQLSYLSVCTTSTHDMSPIRAWWKENGPTTQRYYNEILHHEGNAPSECSSELCKQILMNHLNSPSMLTILPLQDWLSIDDKYRAINPQSERINIPADANHYWGYRMHLNIETLIAAKSLMNNIRIMIQDSFRTKKE